MGFSSDRETLELSWLSWEKLGDLPSKAHPWNFLDRDVGRGTVSLQVLATLACTI